MTDFETRRELLSTTLISHTVFWEEERTRLALKCLLKSGMQEDWTISYTKVSVRLYHPEEKTTKLSHIKPKSEFRLSIHQYFTFKNKETTENHHTHPQLTNETVRIMA